MKGRLCLLLLTAAPAFGVTVGETYDQVVAEKGAPAGSTVTGSVRVMTYPDVIIKLKDKVVVSVLEPGKTQVVVKHPTEVPAIRPVAEWETDFGTALAHAKARKCHLLIVYTGSDWSPWCQKMDAEIYSQPEFARYSREKFVLLKLDYLRHAPQTGPAFSQNEALALRYNVKSFPTVVIVDMNGVAVGRLNGYREGGTATFIRMIKPFE